MINLNALFEQISQDNVIAIVGWLGVLLCTTGYFLLSIKYISAENISFQLLNIIGGLCLVATGIYTHDTPNVIANVLWMCVGLFAVGRQLRTKRHIRRR